MGERYVHLLLLETAYFPTIKYCKKCLLLCTLPYRLLTNVVCFVRPEAITPKNVRVSVASTGEAALTWKNSALIEGDERVTIERQEVARGVVNASEEWQIVERDVEAEDNSYDISQKDAEKFKYRIRVTSPLGMSSTWIEAGRPKMCNKREWKAGL